LVQDLVHKKIIENEEQVKSWLWGHRKKLPLPFYSSVDVRDSSYKVVSVDANIFPAGFNNICPVDKENVPKIIHTYLHNRYGSGIQRIALVTEEHTNNPYYWDNVHTLSKMISNAGYEVKVAVPKVFTGSTKMKAASGNEVEIFSAIRHGHSVTLGTDFVPDIIISNNDFSEAHEDWAQGLDIPINPPREMGWYQRKKSAHFEFYNQLAKEFADIIGVDPWVFQVQTELFSNFDLSTDEGAEALAERVDLMVAKIKTNYDERGIKDSPFVFIKNNSGTYGLAVVAVSSGDEIRGWNAKTRKDMKVSKGKRTVAEVIIQEGVKSSLVYEEATAEPTIYIVGCELIGGFLRAHPKKGPQESLNSPGAVYKRLCVSDLKVSVQGHPLENVYGWVARLSSLAIGSEIHDMQMKMKHLSANESL